MSGSKEEAIVPKKQNMNELYKNLDPAFKTALQEYVLLNNKTNFNKTAKECGFIDSQLTLVFDAIRIFTNQTTNNNKKRQYSQVENTYNNNNNNNNKKRKLNEEQLEEEEEEEEEELEYSSSNEDECCIDKIIDHRKISGNKFKYLIQWENNNE
eukprot:209615_1